MYSCELFIRHTRRAIIIDLDIICNYPKYIIQRLLFTKNTPDLKYKTLIRPANSCKDTQTLRPWYASMLKKQVDKTSDFVSYYWSVMCNHIVMIMQLITAFELGTLIETISSCTCVNTSINTNHVNSSKSLYKNHSGSKQHSRNHWIIIHAREYM